MGKVTVGGHWLVEEKIGEGSFGEVFRAVHVKTKEQCAIKRELVTEEHPQLPQEAEFLKMLEGPSFIPKVHWFGQEKLYNALVMDLLGPNLRLVRQAYEKLPVAFVSDIAIQMVNILEHVHNKGIVYRDVKPDNFLLEREFAISIKELEKWDSEDSPKPLEDYRPLLGRSHKISLVDFGLSTFYIDKRTKRHVPRKQPPTKYKTGTARYAAIGVHHGLPHARRDDLESLGYVILEMIRGTLPWAGVTARNAIEGWAKMLKMKANIPLEELFEGVPRGFMDFLQYARNLDFEQEPDYNYARKLLMSAACGGGYDSELIYTTGIEDCFSSRPMSPSPSTPANELIFWNDADDNAFRDFDGGYHSDEWINHNDDNAVMAEVSAWDGNVKVPWLEESSPTRNWHPRCVEEQRTRSLRDLQSRRPSVPSPLSISIPPRPNSAMNTSRGAASPNNKFDSNPYYPGVNENIPLAPRRSIPNIRNTNSLATRFLKRSVPNLRDQARHNIVPQSSKRIMPHMQDKKGNNSSRCYSFKDNNLPYSSSQPTTPREEINNPMNCNNVKYSPQDARFSLKDSRYTPQDVRYNFRGRERANTFSQFSNTSKYDNRHPSLPSSPSTPSRQGGKPYKEWERSHTFTNGHDSPVSPGIQNNSPNSPYSPTNNWSYKRDRSHTFANGGRPKDNNYGGKNRPVPLGQLPSRNYVNCQPQNHLQQNSGYNRSGTPNNVQKIRQNHQEENYPPRSVSTTPTCGHRRSNSQEKVDLKKQFHESSKTRNEPTVTSPSVTKVSHSFDHKITNNKNHNSMDKEMSNDSLDQNGTTSNNGSLNKQANQQHNHVTFANVEDNYSYYPDRPSNGYRRQSFSAVNVEGKTFRTRSLTLPDLRQDIKNHTAVNGKNPRPVLKNNNQSVTNLTPKDNVHFQDTEKKKKKKKKWPYYMS
ncbi:hypothetical protein RclHR1_08090008 [Rhizophagus clarus]|uniref:non-specific serine/threonine protein kinase n=1 Tax=Rhizophagus clarus TaxID=94130 RepID=A0A2Z6RZV2_9GLOM|nr:hypothetical protein RclHR1_08090008 [Rhizophagus clarus]